MGDLWRSEPMTLLQFVIPTDDAHDVVFDLGNLGVVQFKDLNPDINTFQRNFVNEILRIDELQRKLRYFEEQLKKTGRTLPEVFSDDKEQEGKRGRPLGPQEIPEMENFFEETERELQQMNDGFEAITQNIRTHEEHVLVLQRYDEVVSEYGSEAGGYSISGAFLSVKSGVISTTRVHTFERILWRATKGNIFFRSSDLNTEGDDGPEDKKSMFMILFKEGEHLSNCVEKLCQAFGTSLYDCPDNSSDRQGALATAQQQIQELKEVLRYNQERHTSLLNTLYENMQKWRDDLLREKAIYHILNQFRFDSRRLTLLAEGWCPTANVREVAAILQRQGKLPIIVRQITPENESPPTFFRTNKFTQTFQDIVDAYGVAGYQETNPAVFTIITFPFLFAVMFGDVGHGILMLLFSLWMLKNEKEMQRQDLGEMLSMLFVGRYVIVMMALFSIFTGFMYNEAFGVSMALFPSQWYVNGSLTMEPKEDYVYPFGVDSYWHTASNSLYFYNSLKMKMSVLMGVTQMSLGIVLSAGNAIYFRKPYNLWFEFVPQILFMLCLFGYLCVLVIIKWFEVFDEKAPPGLLNVFLQMFLSPMNFDKATALYPGQHAVQVFLLVVGVICVPMMLLPKPFLLRRDHMQRVPHTKKGFTQFENESDINQPTDSAFASDRNTLGVRQIGEASGEADIIHDEEEFEFSEIFIEQVIHTIEFVLGAISNTASYLRLWALSLAHAQLSSVFYKTVFVQTLKSTQMVQIFIGFAVWAGLTLAVLMIMESLSAFLHALRLHWVEFQNKFYHGDGKQFHPFNFREFDEFVV